MQSIQINTSPLLRNFATRMTETSIQVSTKLGSQTLLRAEFPPAHYPPNAPQQIEFLKELIARTNPGALDLLKEVASRCIEDQQRAIGSLIGEGKADTPSSPDGNPGPGAGVGRLPREKVASASSAVLNE